MQYFYDKQIRRYIQQFVRIFAGFNVQKGVSQTDGSPIFQTVPVRYGDINRMAAHIIRDNGENMISSTPFMSCYVTSLSLAPDRRTQQQFRDKVQVAEKKFDTATGQYIDDEIGNTYEVTRYTPVPYDMEMQIDIWTSNTDQKLQLLEQLLVLFNPSIDIHIGNNPVDWTTLTRVEMTNMTWSSRSVPSGTDDTIDVATIMFKLPILMTPPAQLRKQTVIQTIMAKIHDVDHLNLETFRVGESFDSQFTSYTVISLENYKLELVDNHVKLIDYKDSVTPIIWSDVLMNYGEFRNGISQIRLYQGTEPNDSVGEILGTLTVDDNDATRLAITIDVDTLPTDTLTPINAILDPTAVYPGDGTIPPASTGQRYLLIGDVPDSINWGTSAKEHDIIEYNGSSWTVIFDANASTGKSYVTNLTTGAQYEWTGDIWQSSFEGTYNAGFWRLFL